MLRRLFGRSRFVKKMNMLMEIYSYSHNAEATYKELQALEPLIRREGERYLYELNRAALLYDMKDFKKAADIAIEIPPFNPEFDAKCAEVKTKIMDAMQRG